VKPAEVLHNSLWKEVFEMSQAMAVVLEVLCNPDEAEKIRTQLWDYAVQNGWIFGVEVHGE
jgi:hypothetical protein